MKEPTSAHGLSSCVLLVGTPISSKRRKTCQTPRQGANTLFKARAPREGANTLFKARAPRRGANTLAKAKRLAKLSPNTWSFFPLAGIVPRSLFSLSYASWAACASKGSPRHRASWDLTSRGLTHPPALWSPDSHIPKRRWCSAKRGT